MLVSKCFHYHMFSVVAGLICICSICIYTGECTTAEFFNNHYFVCYLTDCFQSSIKKYKFSLHTENPSADLIDNAIMSLLQE